MTTRELIAKWSPKQKRKILAALSAELLRVPPPTPERRAAARAELARRMASPDTITFDELMLKLEELTPLPPLPPPTAEERAARETELARRLATRDNTITFDELMRRLDELPTPPPPSADERAARKAELDQRLATREKAIEFDEFMEILSKES